MVSPEPARQKYLPRSKYAQYQVVWEGLLLVVPNKRKIIIKNGVPSKNAAFGRNNGVLSNNAAFGRKMARSIII